MLNKGHLLDWVISTFIGIYLFDGFDCSAVLWEHCDIGGLYQVAIPGLSLGHRCVKAASDNSGASSRLADAPGGSQNTPWERFGWSLNVDVMQFPRPRVLHVNVVDDEETIGFSENNDPRNVKVARSEHWNGDWWVFLPLNMIKRIEKNVVRLLYLWLAWPWSV